MSAAATAQQPPQTTAGGPETIGARPDEPSQLVRGPLFISPMGQPFRGAGEHPTPPILTWFADADADADSKLSREEFINQGVRFFHESLDSNHDGQATSWESTRLWRAEAPEMLAGERATPRPRPPQTRDRNEPTRGGGGDPSPSSERRPRTPQAPPTGARAFGITNDAEPVMSCDLDLSRRVTLEEFQACAGRRFDALDANGDSFFEIEESERAAAFALGHQPGRSR
jgi:hypothetical protein